MSDKTRAEELVWKKKFPNEEFDLDNYYDWARENSKEAYNLLYEVSKSEIDTITNSVKIYVEVIDDQKREIDELTKEVERLNEIIVDLKNAIKRGNDLNDKLKFD